MEKDVKTQKPDNSGAVDLSAVELSQRQQAIEALVSEGIPRERADELVAEFGADRERLKAAAWVDKNLPTSDR